MFGANLIVLHYNLYIMATYEQGLLGTFKGKVGNIVGSNWRDIDILRSLPRKPNKPASEKQLAQRLKFSMAVDFLSPMRKAIRISPQGKQKSKTDFNEALTIVMKNMEGEYPDFIIPFKAVVFTKGSLMNILPLVDTKSEGEIKLSWSSRLGYGATENDVIHVIVYNGLLKDFFSFNAVKRSDAEYTLYADEIGNGPIHIWTFVTAANGTNQSNSMYCGVFELKLANKNK